MDTTYKILSYVDDLIDAYKEPIQRLPGLTRKPKDIIRTIEFYTSNQYTSGNKDELGREKPFYNVSNYRVTVAKVATDLDVKDIKYEPDSLKFSLQTLMINKELYKYLKASNFSATLNDMGQTRPKYGGVLVKKSDVEGELKIEVVDWVNVDFDPSDIAGGVIIESFYLQPSKVASYSDTWENVDELLKEHAKVNKGKPASVEIKEVTGEFPESFYPDNEDAKGKKAEKNDSKYKRMCFYIGCVEKKKFLLYYEYQKEPNYKYLAWEKVGDGLGRGVVEEGFESQWAINDTMIAMKNAMELEGKVVLSTTSKKISGNAITDVNSGHIFEMEDGKTLTSLNLLPSAFPQFHNVIELWNQQYDKVSSTYNANTGEAPTAGTPYSQTALLNQVANSPFEYQREVWGIFVNEILNDWILPYIKKIILKGHNLVADYTTEELEILDEAVSNFHVGNQFVEDVLAENEVSQEGVDMQKEEIKANLMKKFGSKREYIIPEKWLDVGGKITANITGELKNKSAMLQSLDGVFKTIMSTFNPQTGQFAALQDPTLKQIFSQIVELSGIPISSATMYGSSKPSSSKSI